MRLMLLLITIFTPLTLLAQSISVPVEEEVRGQVISRYESSVVTSIDSEELMIRVRFLHHGIQKEAVFTPRGVWQRTIYPVIFPDLTTEVKELLSEPQYDDYDVQQIEVIEQPQIKIYGIDLLNVTDNKTLSITVTDSGIVL